MFTPQPMPRDDNGDGPTRRAVARKERRDAGDRTSELARTLMQLPDATVEKLQLDEDLTAVLAKARRVTAPVARRRAERSLAGELRRLEDIANIVKRIASVQERGVVSQKLFHQAEKWRTRLIAEDAAAAEFPGGNEDPLPELIIRARRERDTGKPPGAARALFRHVMATLEAKAKAEEADEADED